MKREIFVDSGAWIAMSFEHDAHRDTALQVYRRLGLQPVTFITTNLVVGESYALIHRFGGHGPAIRFLQILRQSNRLQKVYSDADLEVEAEAVLVKYADQDFSFVDAVSFAVMRHRGITEAFAFDHHFHVAGFATFPPMW
jgi:predicted nucleic acid-binding protein